MDFSIPASFRPTLEAARSLVETAVEPLEPLALFYRLERAARIYDGPDEVHREALARRLLAPYRG